MIPWWVAVLAFLAGLLVASQGFVWLLGDTYRREAEKPRVQPGGGTEQ